MRETAVAAAIDLTVPFSPDYPCWWPELSKFQAVDSMTLERDNIACRRVSFEEHNGTHMDAPCHVGDIKRRAIDPRTSDQVGVESLWGRARVIDVMHIVGHENGVSPWIGPDCIEAYEAETEPLRPSDAVLLRTGWAERNFHPFPDGEAYVSAPLRGAVPGWPAPTGSFVELIADRGISVLGMDIPTMAALQDPFENHRAAFSRGVTPIENLINVDLVPDRQAWFIFLPLLIIGGTGAPGRAMAIPYEHLQVAIENAR